MSLDKYQTRANKTQTVFTFTSEDPKDKILKRIHYSKLKIKGIRNVYNLAFGDSVEGSKDLDDLTISDNQDRDKILATVVNSVYKFSEHHPKAMIYVTGSTDARTRLYRMVIAKYFDALSEIFDIKGVTQNGIFSFEKNKTYESFLITRKII